MTQQNPNPGETGLPDRPGREPQGDDRGGRDPAQPPDQGNDKPAGGGGKQDERR